MRAGKRTLILWGPIAVALLASSMGLPNGMKQAAAQVDWCEKFQHQEDAFNGGEIDLCLEDYADNLVSKTAPLCDPVECVGKDAYRNLVEWQVDLNARWTITGCRVSGDTVAINYEWAEDTTRAAGVDRIIAESTYEVQDGKIVALRDLPPDVTDPQTAQYMNYMTAAPRAFFTIGPGRDADQSPGLALIGDYPDFLLVSVRITPGPAGVPQPIQIHRGTCANLGPVAFSLGDVGGGISYTVLRGVSLGDLQTGNFAIAVQKSEDEPNVFVACGDIPAAAPPAPSVAPVPASQPVAAPAPAMAAPPAGSGLSGDGGFGPAAWWYGLAAGGGLLVVASLIRLGRERRRR